jgi:RNA polymerase sigma factor (sigma-70 family)
MSTTLAELMFSESAGRFPCEVEAPLILEPVERPIETPSMEDIQREVTELFHLHAASLQRFVYSICGNSETAKEGVQEAFLRYYATRLSGQNHSGGKSWLFTTAHNYVLDRLKDSYSRNTVDLSEAENEPDYRQDPSRAVEQQQWSERVFRSLSGREQECLRLRAKGFKYREIARHMEIDTGTVGAIIAHGLSKIRTASHAKTGRDKSAEASTTKP